MKKQQTVTLCGETLNGPLHICAFFNSKEEQYEILLPWLKEGINNKEEVLTILESGSHNDHYSRMSAAGIPLQESIANKQLKVVATEDTYLQGGTFAAERMFELLEQSLKNAQDGPYEGIRGFGDMEWALKNLPGTDELIEYEARVNLLAPKYCSCLICIYDVKRFSASAVSDILATHSHVIMDRKIYKNPQFIEPIKLLEQLLKRPKVSLSRATGNS